MAGCIIFTDPGDDGEVTVKNGYLAYPGMFLPCQTIIMMILTAHPKRRTGKEPLLHPTRQRPLQLALLRRPNNSRLRVSRRRAAQRAREVHAVDPIDPDQHGGRAPAPPSARGPRVIGRASEPVGMGRRLRRRGLVQQRPGAGCGSGPEPLHVGVHHARLGRHRRDQRHELRRCRRHRQPSRCVGHWRGRRSEFRHRRLGGARQGVWEVVGDGVEA